MIKFLASVFIFLGTLFMGEPLYAAQAHGAGGPGINFIYAVINFLILLVILYYFLRRPAREFFCTRSVSTKMAVETAKKHYQESYRRLEEIEARLKNVDVEGKELIHRIKKEAELEKQKLIALARDMAEKIKSDARRIAEQEVKKARQSLRAQASQLVIQLAEEAIAREITPEAHLRLSDDFLAAVQKRGAL